MRPVQKVFGFGTPQNPTMMSTRPSAPDLFDVKGLRQEPAEGSAWADWLQDPRVLRLTGDAFRVACYLRCRLTPPKTALENNLLSELSKSGLFSVEDLHLLHDSADALGAPDEPMVRLPSVGAVPASWNERFIRFYEAYGFARDRGGAERAWMKLERAARQSGIDLEIVITAAGRAKLEAGFRANSMRKRPSSWLNACCWDDDIDGGEYPTASLPLIEFFNRLCPRAEIVETYSPARSDAIRAALQRMPIERWEKYFLACAQLPELFEFVKGPVPITTALSPEMERKVREAVRAKNGGSQRVPS